VVTSYFFPEPLAQGSDAHIFRELLVTVWNRILLRLQDQKITEKEAEEIGFMLRRAWIIGKTFKEKNQQYTLAQWLEKLTNLAKESGINLPVPL
jgi:hypothetical protein